MIKTVLAAIGGVTAATSPDEFIAELEKMTRFGAVLVETKPQREAGGSP